MAARRPVILTFLDHYLPGYRAGGPVRTVLHMTEQLSDDFDFRVVTADRDLGDPQRYEGIAVDRWTRVGEAQVFYRSPGVAGWRALLADPVVRSADLAYLSGVFSTAAALRPLVYRRLGRLRCPVLVPPRGELAPGALAIRRPKKIVFLTLARLTGFYRDCWWHCSSAEEQAELALHLAPPPGRILIAPDLSGRSSAPPDAGPGGATLRIVFLSRIAPKKNLDGALDILARVNCRVAFDIIGPLEDRGYWQRCAERIERMPANVTVRHAGEVHPDAVEQTLRGYDLFLFPTHGENYGHVIREALSAGVPALLSDRTPWRGLADRHAGADLPLGDLSAFAAWIDRFAGLDEAGRQRLREGAHALGNDEAAAAANRETTRHMLLTAIANGQR